MKIFIWASIVFKLKKKFKSVGKNIYPPPLFHNFSMFHKAFLPKSLNQIPNVSLTMNKKKKFQPKLQNIFCSYTSRDEILQVSKS